MMKIKKEKFKLDFGIASVIPYGSTKRLFLTKFCDGTDALILTIKDGHNVVLKNQTNQPKLIPPKGGPNYSVISHSPKMEAPKEKKVAAREVEPHIDPIDGTEWDLVGCTCDCIPDMHGTNACLGEFIPASTITPIITPIRCRCRGRFVKRPATKNDADRVTV